MRQLSENCAVDDFFVTAITWNGRPKFAPHTRASPRYLTVGQESQVAVTSLGASTSKYDQGQHPLSNVPVRRRSSEPK